MAIAPERMGIGIQRRFTSPGQHPYDTVVWDRRDARIVNFATGAVAFEQLGVEVPSTWSLNATNILAQKYFRGTLGTPEREWSLKQVVDRVVDTITAWGRKDGYFVDDAEAETFSDELKYLIIHQKAAFNSPVWFNIGVHGVPQQGSACQPYGALVCTPEGLVPIGKLVETNAVGTKVYDAHGLTKIVAVKANGRKSVLRIHTKAGVTLDATPDHLVWRATGDGTGRFVEAGELIPGDQLTWHRTGEIGEIYPLSDGADVQFLEIDRIEEVGEDEVYDIQTESGEYLSGNLRVHNCFILAVEDSMDSILNWYTEEGIIFKGGSGAGVNLSKIRSSKEGLRGGGTASGPVSFMRGADASAGTIKSGGKCFREGTLVATPEGLRPIEQLHVGDVVLTHKGPQKVADFMPNGVKQCYKVVTREGYEVEVTAGHKFAYWDADLGAFDVKPIEQFQPGDALYVLVEPGVGGVKIPLLPPQIIDGPHATTTVEMRFPTELDDRLAYILGLSYGDGELRTAYPYRLRVAFCKDEPGRLSAERFSSYCEELFGDGPINLGEYDGHFQLGLTRKRLIDFLVVNGIAKGKGSALGFPTILFRAEPEVRAAFAAGLIDADGTYQRRGGWSISSIDRDFLVQFQRLLLTLGVPSKLKVAREARGTWQTLYRLQIVGHTFIDRLVRYIRPYSAKALLTYVPSDGADKGWGYRPSLYRNLDQRVERRGGHRIIDRAVGSNNETTGYGAVATLTRHPDEAVASYAEDLSTCVQVTLQTVTPTDFAETYDIEVQGAHLLSANGIYASNTRRAAKMVILNADHPDIEDFIWCKAIEERKARALRDAGFDMDLDGKDSYSIQYQNANNSVRVTDEFMQAVLDDADWHLRGISTGEVLETIRARDLFRQIAKAAWECADPGMQFDTTINRWHTASNTDRINASNPCSEYMHLDNSACNLASLNLLSFLQADGTFDVDGFKAATEVIFTAQEIIVGNADYPTERIAENSRRFRQLGIGYANLGALLMAQGLPYDSDAGRAWAGAVTALLTGHSYATSARTAARMGPFAGYQDNREPMLNVLRMHRDAASQIDEELVPPELLCAAQESWDSAVEIAEQYGVRNSQASVLAPTGCLVPGTLVATDRGLVRLGTLGDPEGAQWQELDAQVATDNGPQQATRFYVNGLDSVVTVDTARGYRIQGTPQHRVKVVDSTTGEWIWKRFADLAADDLVPLALNQLVGQPQSVPLAPLTDAYWTGEHDARVPREMTPELAELIGYFMGDGSLHSRGLRFCVTAGDDDVVDRLRDLSKSCFGLEAKVTSQTGYAEVRIDSVRLAIWWDACGFLKYPNPRGKGKGYEAHIPNAVLYSNDPVVYGAFLRGLFEADGDTSAGYPTLKNTSLQMARDCQSLLMALGFPTSFSIRERTDGTSWGKAPLGHLRILNLSYSEQWLNEIGFMGARKNAGVKVSDLRQAGRRDYIPLTREMIDRLAPTNDRLRKVLLLEHSRGMVSRRIASELFERTGDSWLRHLLSFFYDRVTGAELAGEEFTYDISVPSNVTYIANGFVSHNTIGLLMDCDTTGIEPDLSLVKMKKLVGGGTMSIVNQTVPRALQQLGYTKDQVDEIVAYIDEHKSIVGAPHLLSEHLPVFACSMGDNTIHYRGHIRLMGAVQPFISGALSKTVNVPEEVTVEDLEQLHIEAWQLGLKAIAIYRDNCKVAQPLATAKKTVADPTASPAEVHDAELALKVAELEKALQRQTVVVKQPIRERLPRKRTSSTFAFRVADCEGYVTVGEYEDGRPGEVFIKVSKQGSTLSGIMDAFSIAISLGLQHGVPLATFVKKYTNMRFEPAGMTDDPDLRIAQSLMDYIFRRLAVDYLPFEERAELGVLTTAERTQQTLPGIEETVTQNLSLDAGPDMRPPRTSSPDNPPAMPVKAESDAPYCFQCGVQMQRAGSCHACPSCGTTSGCS